ncbi:hypothetical protein GCM10010869_49010 [Mesorhizobium tianshanense]|nr:hypothetical protein GCM10010869_49010 [Mesorhizobium tianshanense]
MLIYGHAQAASPHSAFPSVPAVLPGRDEARGLRLGSGRPAVTGGDRNGRSRPPPLTAPATNFRACNTGLSCIRTEAIIAFDRQTGRAVSGATRAAAEAMLGRRR